MNDIIGSVLALLLVQSPTSAQVLPDPVRPAAPVGLAEARAALMKCAIAGGTALALTSQEGAEVLAKVAVYRCVQASPDQRRYGDQDEARMAATDAIVKARAK